MRSLVAVFAHPDDETFAIGGTLARYAGEGVRCSLYCATDGDAGRSSGIPVSSRAELGALRRRELHAAARAARPRCRRSAAVTPTVRSREWIRRS